MVRRDVSSGAGKTRKGVPPVSPASSKAAPTTIELAAGTRVGDYEVERKLGEGAMGTVYAAVHPIISKRVAIKVINDAMSRDAEAVTRFRREARAVAQLASPHIVDVFGFGELPDGRSYYAMEYLTGESLRERLVRGRVPLDEALDVLDQIVRGLEVAHDRGIVHRDLKPENIFIERGGGSVVKLLDFGLVKLLQQPDEVVTRTHAGAFFGTPLYVSPEQIKSAGSVDHRTDIYALGCIAYEMIVGRVPFERATAVELVVAHLEYQPPAPRTLWSGIPSALEALLPAMLAKDPQRRPTLGYIQETIERVRRSAFTAAIAELPAPTVSQVTPVVDDLDMPTHVMTVAAPTVSPARNKRRRPAAVIVGVLGVFGVFAIMLATTSHDKNSNESTKTDVAVAPIIETPRHSQPDATIAPVIPPQMKHVPIADVATPRSAPALRKPDTSPLPSIESTPSRGELDINSTPACEISIDDKPLGRRSPVAGLMLEPGIHKVTLVNDKYGIHETTTVQVQRGKQSRVQKDYSARMSHVDPNGTIDPFRKGSP